MKNARSNEKNFNRQAGVADTSSDCNQDREPVVIKERFHRRAPGPKQVESCTYVKVKDITKDE